MNTAQQRQKTSSVSLARLVFIVEQRPYGVFVSSLLLAVIGIMGVSLLPNVYRATTTILVDPQKIPEKFVSSTITTDPNARLNTLTQQVLGASLLEEIIANNNLYPDLRKNKSREEVLDFMREKTKIEVKQAPDPEQGLSRFTISFEDRDPTRVALITNQIAAGFIERNLKVRQREARGTTQFLSGELQRAKESLETQERELESFKMRHAGATPDELEGNLQALSRLQSQMQSNMDAISRLDQERILLTHTHATDPQAVPLTERDRVLQEKRRLEAERWSLRRQFTEVYPDVVANTQGIEAINAKLAALPEAARGSPDPADENTGVRLGLIDKEMQRHKQQLADLGEQVHGYQSKVDSVPILQTQLVELTRNYEASRQNYQSLLDKTFSAGMSEEMERKQQAERYTVLDPAKIPKRPIRPKRILLMAGVLVASFLLPASTLLMVGARAGFIMSEREIRDLLPAGTPLVGTIPRIQSRADLSRTRQVKVQSILISAVACTVLLIFLLKVRPTL